MSLVLGSQHDSTLLAAESLQREFVVHNRHDDVANVGGCALLHDDDVARMDSGVDHGIALYFDKDRLRRIGDQVLVDCQSIGSGIRSLGGQPRLYALVYAALEETRSRLKASVRRALQKSLALEPQDHSGHRGL